jgi:hypothetical protein
MIVEFLSRPQHRQPWSAEELDALCAFMSVNKPIRKIAEALGRSQEAVSTKARQLGRLQGPTL